MDEIQGKKRVVKAVLTTTINPSTHMMKMKPPASIRVSCKVKTTWRVGNEFKKNGSEVVRAIESEVDVKKPEVVGGGKETSVKEDAVSTKTNDKNTAGVESAESITVEKMRRKYEKLSSDENLHNKAKKSNSLNQSENSHMQNNESEQYPHEKNRKSHSFHRMAEKAEESRKRDEKVDEEHNLQRSNSSSYNQRNAEKSDNSLKTRTPSEDDGFDITGILSELQNLSRKIDEKRAELKLPSAKEGTERELPSRKLQPRSRTLSENNNMLRTTHTRNAKQCNKRPHDEQFPVSRKEKLSRSLTRRAEEIVRLQENMEKFDENKLQENMKKFDQNQREKVIADEHRAKCAKCGRFIRKKVTSTAEDDNQRDRNLGINIKDHCAKVEISPRSKGTMDERYLMTPFKTTERSTEGQMTTGEESSAGQTSSANRVVVGHRVTTWV